MNIQDFSNYCREHIPHFDLRVEMAWDEIAQNRCPLSYADQKLHDQIQSALGDYCLDNDLDADDYDVDDLFDEL